MGKKIKIQKKRLSSFLLYPAIAIWLLSGCATTTTPSATGIEADNTRASLEVYESQEVRLAAKIPEAVQDESEEAEITMVSEPRILIEPIESDLNQVLGIDFTMLEQGKSKLTLTTDKKVDYDLDREGDKSLVLKLHDTTIIPSVLFREIDATHFETALDKVKPSFSKENNEVALVISLREMVPFHIKQAENGLTMHFGQTSIKPPDKKIIPLDLAEAETRSLAATQLPVAEIMGAQAVGSTARERRFKGELMNFDFVDIDVTHILKAINDVTEENIIWDPEIKGRRVSMVLKDVPWDETLDLILKNNELAMRYVGDNILWITTKDKMDRILAEEEAEARRQQEAMESELEREEALKKKAEQQEPLITDYLPVDFASADEIQGHITLTDRGKMSIDTRTNTIIIKDIATSIEEAKKTVAQFDTPVKQIMIEARIVDASENFSRDLGIKWNAEADATEMGISTTEGATAEIEGTGAAHISSDGALGGSVQGGTFSTNAPTTPWGNIGLYFGRMSSTGMGILSLDASLALAETEGTAKTLSAPKVIAREGTSATISSGDSIIIPATENVASTTLDATLSLTVTPTSVSYNDYITMDVSVTDDQAPSSSRLLRKAINTTLMVKSGETVVIGGIIKETEGSDEAGLPWLRNIPGLGWLFKARTKVSSKSELLIFLTPTVLPSP